MGSTATIVLRSGIFFATNQAPRKGIRVLRLGPSPQLSLCVLKNTGTLRNLVNATRSASPATRELPELMSWNCSDSKMPTCG